MFREMRRCKQQLPQEECISILEHAPRGVLAVHGEDGYPYALPLDFIYMEGKIYFHGAKTGHKLDAIAADDRVSFCVMDEGFRNEGEWFLNIKSVILFGRIKKITDPDETVRIARQLGLKYFPDPEEVEKELQKSGARVQILELTADHMTGKRVKEK